jgi:hypothetical protein
MLNETLSLYLLLAGDRYVSVNVVLLVTFPTFFITASSISDSCNHGGVDAENVIEIDANNSSSPYLYVYDGTSWQWKRTTHPADMIHVI